MIEQSIETRITRWRNTVGALSYDQAAALVQVDTIREVAHGLSVAAQKLDDYSRANKGASVLSDFFQRIVEGQDYGEAMNIIRGSKV